MIINFKIFEKLSPEEMLLKPEVKKELKNGFGDDDEINMWIDNFHSKSKNYKDNIFYRVEGAGSGFGGGVGNGLYLGKDKDAINNFYNIENVNDIDTYLCKNVKWLDLMNFEDFHNFENKYGKLLNSFEISDIVMKLGYDGIVYYDPHATGEEYVLFNTDKATKIN